MSSPGVSALQILRDAWVVATHELADSLRSRKVVVLALLYLGGAVAGTVVFVEVLETIEAALADTLAVARPDQPGAITAAVMQSEEFTKALTRMLRDGDLAAELAMLPPLALFYGWLAFTFSPLMIMLTAADCVAEELASGGARYALVRTSRLSFSLGKLLGQTILMAVSISAGAVGVWVTGLMQLEFFEAGRTAGWLAVYSTRAWVYGFAHVGLAVGLSHMTRSMPISRALGLLSLMGLGVVWGVLRSPWAQDAAPVAAQTLMTLLPRAHHVDLWRTALDERLPALIMLTCLGVVYFAAGYRFRLRRDV